MTLMVTGAAGFIGQAVIKAALASGESVTAFTRSPKKLCAHPLLNIVPISDFADITPKGGEQLVHLAWGEVGKYTDPHNLTSNLTPQFDFLKRMVDEGVRNITVSGTCLEYGMQEGVLHEDISCSPVTYYGLAKLTLLRMLEIYRRQTDNAFSLKWLRYFYVYGEGQRPQSLFGQLEAAIRRGDTTFPMSPADQQRDFITVETLAHNTLAAARQTQVEGVINIGNGRCVTVLKQAQKLLKAHSSDITLNTGHYPYPTYEPFAFWADTAKLATLPDVKFDSHISAPATPAFILPNGTRP